MAKGRTVYVRAKKEKAGDGALWPEKKKMEAVTSYLACGSISATSVVTGVPVTTLKAWKQSSWWKEAINELQYEDNIQTSSKLSKLLDKSIIAMEDRLDNGDYMYDPKTGEHIRIPVKFRDVHKVTSDIVDKKQKLLDLHIKREQAKKEKQATVTVDHLVQLAQAFAQFAQGKDPKDVTPQKELASEIIEGEHTEILEGVGYEETNG